MSTSTQRVLRTRQEAAEAFGVSVRTLDGWIAADAIKSVSLGRAVRVPQDEIDRAAVEGLPVVRRNTATR